MKGLLIKNASQQTDQATNIDASQQTDEFVTREEVETQCNIVNPTTSIATGPEQPITTREVDQQTDQRQLNTTGTDPETKRYYDADIQTGEYVERTEQETQYDIEEPRVSIATGPEQTISTRDASQQTDEFIMADIENVHRPLKRRITSRKISDKSRIFFNEAAKKAKSLAFYVFCFTIPITIIFGPLITAAFYSHQITMLLTPLIPFFV